MMLKLLPLAALALGLSSGAAFADRGHGGDHRGRYEHRGDRDRGDRGGRVIVRDHGRDYRRGNTVVIRDHGRGHRGNVIIRDHGHRGGGRVIVRGEPRYRDYGYRRPIYVSRPAIRHRYYNYYRRPAILVENYSPMAGYYWVNGSWSWNGYEWIWTPGHYEPDPSYYGYYDSY